MSDMLQSFVQGELDRQIKDRYPHIQHPAGLYARIVQAVETDHGYNCIIRILDTAWNTDEDFPEIPSVFTDLPVKTGDVVVVLLLYGGTGVFVLGKYRPS